MLGFFLDSQMTIPVSATAPKKFLVPLKGGVKTTTVYLGDPYSTVMAAPATAGALSLVMDDTSEFLPSGQAMVGTQTVSYTGVQPAQLTGVTGLTADVTIGTIVRPLKQWIGEQQCVLYSSGTDKNTIGIAMRVAGDPSFNYPGMPLILSTSIVPSGPNPVGIDLQITVPGGILAEFSNWNIATSSFYPRALGDDSAPTTAEFGQIPVLNCDVLRRDQQLGMVLRILPTNRSVAPNLPGFVWGEYRWRDSTEINQRAILPSNWSIDPDSLGVEKFIAGIGATDDLAPVGIVQEDDSIFLQVSRGHYYTGTKGYYLPATPQLDFLPSDQTTLILSQTPAEIYPIFVGTYQLDSQGYYEKSTEYRYQTAAAIARGTNLPPLWYTLNRKNKTITLNQPMTTGDIFLGTISGQSVDYFNIPTYPVGQVLQVYVLAAAGTSPTVATNWIYDENLGSIVITSPSGSGVSVPGTLQGMSVFATCTPALAVLYETGSESTLTIDSVDLNPAFAGLSNGYVYLEQSRQEAAALILSCDKPLIPVPATLASIIGLIAYGPVYFQGDYALLQVKAFSGVQDEIVSNVKLKVLVDPATFTGLINYVDPLVTPIEVITGADGIANLIFTPSPNFGVYVPTSPAAGGLAGIKTTTVADDTVVLPLPVPISQIWNETEGWFVSLYLVLNNNPLFGKVGANTAAGEIAFATSGTPGTATYKTNGARQPWLNSNNILIPVKVLDANGNDFTSSQFDGNVVSLVYGQSIPNASPTAAYFLTFLQRAVIRMQEENSDVLSNSIMLQIAMSPPINDDVWLTLNDQTNGILNQFRLGISSN